jgi:hypothetical protein
VGRVVRTARIPEPEEIAAVVMEAGLVVFMKVSAIVVPSEVLDEFRHHND